MERDGVTIITLTGGRPRAFAMCAQFIARQTYTGPLQWIVVDDMSCGPIKLPHDRLLLTSIFPVPRWQPGQNTMARNLLVAIPEIQYDKILWFEDDDYYAADYVESMAAALKDNDIAGETHAIYYHVGRRAWLRCPNDKHASMCATGIKSSMLPMVADICERARGLSPYLDIHLWEQARGHRLLMGARRRVIGIKGLPGRPGIGMGHRPETHWHQWTADPELQMLHGWIGDDIELYRGFYGRH